MLPDVALGAIVAAIIGAMISLAGLIVAKESKVSEFRQAWIDGLRKELASFASNLNAFADARGLDYANDKERFDKLKEHTNRLNEAYFAVAFRLNVSEQSSDAVRQSMVRLAGCVNSPDDFFQGNFQREQITFIEVSSALLKEEWKRVKSGEKAYRWTRWMATALIAVLILLTSLIIGLNLISHKPAPKANADASQLISKLKTTLPKQQPHGSLSDKSGHKVQVQSH